MIRAPHALTRRTPETGVSPFSYALALGDIQRLAKELQDLKTTHEAEHQATLTQIKSEHAQKMTELDGKIALATQHVASIKKGDPGEPGADAEPVNEAALETRVLARVLPKVPKLSDIILPPVDYETITQNAAKIVTGKIKPTKGEPGKPGKNADPKEVVALVIETIKKDKLLKMEHITGLSTEIASYRNQLAGKHYGETTKVRGGGDTIAAGSGVTITSSNGVKTINAAGGTLTELAATGTINSSNTIFTFLSKPTYIFIDGVKYRENEGWTWSGLTATYTKAPDYSTWGEK